MKVKFVNPQKHYKEHRREYLGAIDSTIAKGNLIDREELKSFEKNFASFTGTKYAVGVNSGFDALHLSCISAGLKKGEEVIVPGHTFIGSVSAVSLTGAKPILVDVGNEFNLDLKEIKKAMTSRTKAIMPVHLNGHMCDMEKIMEFADANNLIVIEDAAQAVGAKLLLKNKQWKKAGSFGLTGCFSMYPLKILGSFGDSGVVTTNNPEIAKKITLLRYNGEDRTTREFVYHGFSALLDNVWARVLDVKLKYLPEWIKKRRVLAENYRKGLAGLSEIRTPHFEDRRFFDVYQNYVIRAENRDSLKEYLDKNHIETMISWPRPIYSEPALKPNKLSLAKVEKLCKEVLSLPMYPELTFKEQAYVIQAVRGFYQK